MPFAVGSLAHDSGLEAAVDLSDKIPGMTDAALDNLRTNAERLGHAGSPSQRTAATAILPAIEAEQTTRKAAKRERSAEASRAAGVKRRAIKKEAATAAT
jgi:hypothetical protein